MAGISEPGAKAAGFYFGRQAVFTIALEFNPLVDFPEDLLEIPKTLIDNPDLTSKIKAFILVPTKQTFFELSVNGETIFSIESLNEFPEMSFIIKQLNIFLA